MAFNLFICKLQNTVKKGDGYPNSIVFTITITITITIAIAIGNGKGTPSLVAKNGN